MTKNQKINFLIAAVICGAFALVNSARAQGTAFTYQGRLQSGANFANGAFNLKFSLFDTNASGTAIAGPVTNTAVTVTNGLFTTLVDLGNVFNGSSNWLEIAVATNGSSTFTNLTPRQQVTPAPYALTAGQVTGSISAFQIFGQLPSTALGGSYPGTVILSSAVNSFSGNGSNLTALNASQLATGTVADTRLSGNVALLNASQNFTGVTNSFAGSVGIGTITPGKTLEVTGGVLGVPVGGSVDPSIFLRVLNSFTDGTIPSSDVAGIGFGQNSTREAIVGSTYGFDFLDFYVTGNMTNPAVRIAGNRNVGIGTTAPSSALQVVGTITATGFSGNGAGLTNITVASSSLPSLPTAAIGSLSLGSGSVPQFVAVAGRYVYVVNSGSNTLEIIDASTPSNPVKIGLVSTGSGSFPRSVAVVGRYAYVANANTGTIGVFDVSDPALPLSVGSVLAPNNAGPFSIAVAGHYAYLAASTSTTLQIFDVATPANPVYVSSVSSIGDPFGVALSGRYAYVANNSGSLQVCDTGNPLTPVNVGSVSTGNGSLPRSVAVSGRYAYMVNNGSNTLQIFDVSNPASPAKVSTVTTGINPISVTVMDRYAYVVNNAGNSLQIFDISNPSNPVSFGSVTTGSAPDSVAVSGHYAYVVNAAGTLQVFDLGGIYSQQLEAGTAEVGTLQTRDSMTVGNNLDVRGGLTVSASARISGGLSADSLKLNAPFSGDGSGLTNLTLGQTNSTSSDVSLGYSGNYIASGVVGAVISGGGKSNNSNSITSDFSFIGSGFSNSIATDGSFIGGGYFNSIAVNCYQSFIGGGYQNLISGNSDRSFIGGGEENTVNGSHGMIPGGLLNVAGPYSFAAGQLAQAQNSGDFVWGDRSGSTTSSTGNNQFIARASGGFVFYTGTGSGGAQLAPGATAWTTLSDRNAKKNFQPVNAGGILEKLAAIPIERWNYKWEKDSDTPNIGPMAQDFKAAFFPGRDDKGITTLEFDGVELAAIQGLNQKLEAENSELKARLDKLEKLVSSLSQSGSK